MRNLNLLERTKRTAAAGLAAIVLTLAPVAIEAKPGAKTGTAETYTKADKKQDRKLLKAKKYGALVKRINTRLHKRKQYGTSDRQNMVDGLYQARVYLLMAEQFLLAGEDTKILVDGLTQTYNALSRQLEREVSRDRSGGGRGWKDLNAMACSAKLGYHAARAMSDIVNKRTSHSWHEMMKASETAVTTGPQCGDNSFTYFKTQKLFR